MLPVVEGDGGLRLGAVLQLLGRELVGGGVDGQHLVGGDHRDGAEGHGAEGRQQSNSQYFLHSFSSLSAKVFASCSRVWENPCLIPTAGLLVNSESSLPGHSSSRLPARRASTSPRPTAPSLSTAGCPPFSVSKVDTLPPGNVPPSTRRSAFVEGPEGRPGVRRRRCPRDVGAGAREDASRGGEDGPAQGAPRHPQGHLSPGGDDPLGQAPPRREEQGQGAGPETLHQGAGRVPGRSRRRAAHDPARRGGAGAFAPSSCP